MKRGLSAFIALLCIAFVLTGCRDQVTPEDRLKEYVGHWNKGDFAAMYSGYLNKETKEIFGEKGFVERQEKLQTDLGIENIKVTYTKPKKDKEWDTEEPASFPIQVKMDTSAGPVTFEKTMKLMHETHDEKENWFVEWDTSFIFPELGDKDKIRISTLPPARGEILDRNGLPIAINGKGYEIGIEPGNSRMLRKKQS